MYWALFNGFSHFITRNNNNNNNNDGDDDDDDGDDNNTGYNNDNDKNNNCNNDYHNDNEQPGFWEIRCLISNLISWRVSPTDPWSFVMTCSLGIYVGMQTARAQSNYNDSEYWQNKN